MASENHRIWSYEWPRRALATAMVAAGWACTASSDPGGSPDAGAPITPRPDAGFTEQEGGADPSDAAVDGDANPAGACHTLPQASETSVSWVTSTAPAPTATGGTIANGRYILSSFKLYTSEFADGTLVYELGRVSVEVEGTTFRILLTDGEGRDLRATQLMTFDGVNVTTTVQCTSGVDAGASFALGSGSFSASPISFTFFGTHPYGPLETVYTMQ